MNKIEEAKTSKKKSICLLHNFTEATPKIEITGSER